VLLGCLAVRGQCKTLCALPASRMGGNGFVLEVERDVVGGLDGEGFPNRPRWRRIRVAIALAGEIRVPLGHGMISASGEERGERSQGLRATTLDGPPASGAVYPSIGPLVAPVLGLGLKVVEVGELSKGPEGVPDRGDGPLFDVAVFLGLPHVTGDRGALAGTPKLQERLVASHHGSVMFDDRGEHVVVDQRFWGALAKVKRMQQAAVPCLLSLGVSQCERQHAALTCNHGQAVEFARGVAVGERAKVPPVDLALHPGWGVETEKGRRVLGTWPHAVQGISSEGDSALAALLLKALSYHHGRDRGGNVEQALHVVFEGIKLTGLGDQRPVRGGIVEVFVHRLSAEAQGGGDLANRESLMGQVMDVKDGASVNPRLLRGMGG
jgi:hypothetical protein